MLGILIFALIPFNAFARAQQCTIIYALNGIAYESFNQQVSSLGPHLLTKKVDLIDLNKWQGLPPHIEVSGREKALLRKQFALQSYDDNAVLLDRDGKIVERFSNTVDLVEMLLRCNAVKNTTRRQKSSLAKQ